MPQTLPPFPNYGADKAITLALRLAHAENAFLAFTSGQIDAILDPKGEAYLLRPAQERLRQNESWLKALLASIPDAITVVSRGGTISFQNKAVTRVLGFGPQDLLGKSIFDFVCLADRAHFHSAFLNVIEGILESVAVVFQVRTDDGAFRTVEATIGKLDDPTSTSVVLSLRPVTGFAPEYTEPEWHPGVPDPENGDALQKDDDGVTGACKPI